MRVFLYNQFYISMIELVYYSISNNEINTNVINNILNTSRNYNKKNNITGCLLYHDKIFLQILEGEKDEVLKLYEKIKKDTRHQNVTLVIKENIVERLYSDWNMAYKELNDSHLKVKQFIKNIRFFLTIMKNNLRQ
ncbi:BLUF domain-containing protein [Polaribacter ponticola]|uniref:BLUF domain-containing protein n=1 Tax=Polaribacter ponticola TaxID=2978475 RepID=A0ABT5SFD9_9FLAO|nr:BLUF domain-containing protein [Polaribacter sp. MSW5]MDD7915962.1 BLUF domain-containing protein [Polaribacter sp. MSW5]